MVLLVDAGGVLTSAGVEKSTVDQILEMLEGGREQVRRSQRMQRIPAGALGGAATALELDLHAGKAHDVVVRAMAEMVAGLEGYHDGVEHFRRDVHETDDQQAAEMTRRERRLEQVQAAHQLALGEACTQGGAFDPSCRVPGEEGRG